MAKPYESSYAWLMKAFIEHQYQHAADKNVVGKKAIAALARLDQASAKAFEQLPKIDELKKTQELVEASINKLRDDPQKGGLAQQFLQQSSHIKAELAEVTSLRQEQITAYHDIKELQEQYKNRLNNVTDPSAEKEAADLLATIRKKTNEFTEKTSKFIGKFLDVEAKLETSRAQTFNELKPEARKDLTPSTEFKPD